MYSEIKKKTHEANVRIGRSSLVTLTWGNVSIIDRNKNLVCIKPSGVSYEFMQPDDMVLVDFKGNPFESTLKPSSDLPTHLFLYKNWPEVGAIIHTHSTYSVMFSQAQKSIKCYGTTHADCFCGEVPVTRQLTEDEVSNNYENSTGKVIVETFNLNEYDPMQVPGVLVANHAPFVWGKNINDAVRNAISLEEIAKMAMGTLSLDPNAKVLKDYVLKKHFYRKHGEKAYYGQKNSGNKR